jgi:cytochrome c-type biogenesis protein CcmH/NrfF
MERATQKKESSKGASAARNMRKHLQCPKCKSRFIDSSLSTVTEIRILSANAETQADFYVKCNICNTELAIKKLG